MKPVNNSRRIFLGDSAKAMIGVSLGAGAVGSFLESCDNAPSAGGDSGYKTGFQQSKLPYDYAALEKAIDARTMEIHYTKHAASYATALNEAAKAEGVDTTKSVEDVLANVSKYSVKMRNNAGGHFNHEMFWKSMTATSAGKPSGKLAEAITSSFGSFEAFTTQFNEAAKTRFGSGWAWLYLDGNKKLLIGSTPNQDNPLMDVSEIKGTPVLGLDVWEHAYYLRYQNKRPDYVSAWWNVVNWDFVGSRFQQA